jgi:hypothetical protein
MAGDDRMQGTVAIFHAGEEEGNYGTLGIH